MFLIYQILFFFIFLISPFIILFRILKKKEHKTRLNEHLIKNNLKLISYGVASISEINFNSKIDHITSLDIFKLTNKYFSKPFLSISGNKKICLEIYKRWQKNF